MQRHVKDETAGAFEGGGIPARTVMLFKNQRFESLTGESRGTAQSTQTRADDHRIVFVFSQIGTRAGWENASIKGYHGSSRQ